MKTNMPKFKPLLALLASLVLAAIMLPASAQAQSGCLSSAASRQAISAGNAKALGTLMQQRGEGGLVSNIIEASLCQTSGNRYYYQVKLLLSTGKVAKIRFFANDGSNF